MDRIKKHPKTGKFVKHSKPNICTIKDCDNRVRGKGFCNTHYLRLVRYGDPHFRRKAANGEGGISAQGYKEITIDGKRILKHRYVMERHLDRPLRSYEIVHHKDGNKLNNSIKNLELTARDEHVKHHPEILDNLKLGPKSRRRTNC